MTWSELRCVVIQCDKGRTSRPLSLRDAMWGNSGQRMMPNGPQFTKQASHRNRLRGLTGFRVHSRGAERKKPKKNALRDYCSEVIDRCETTLEWVDMVRSRWEVSLEFRIDSQSGKPVLSAGMTLLINPCINVVTCMGQPSSSTSTKMASHPTC